MNYIKNLIKNPIKISQLSILVCGFLIILLGCSQKNKQNSNVIKENKIVDKVITQEKNGYELLKEIPKDWIALTQYNNQDVIFQPCDSENLSITIRKNANSYDLGISHGHDITFDSIIRITKKNNNYIFHCSNTSNERLFSLTIINNKKGIGLWKNDFIFKDGAKYVNRDRENLFQKIEQPCQECWDDCD
ncbi:hypothetical protein [Aquimarina algiphila]|uniref:hypothetical protein n=1 Tax=Aquimarina algiphila TaxID=2047982 RepID=UPI002492E82A|nr:hypothetical protein [Aquimarina algiphila]